MMLSDETTPRHLFHKLLSYFLHLIIYHDTLIFLNVKFASFIAQNYLKFFRGWEYNWVISYEIGAMHEF